MSDQDEIISEPIRKKKGQNIKGVENKRTKALENLKAGREKRQALLKAKREAEKENNEYTLDSSSDEEVPLKEYEIIQKKKGKNNKDDNLQEQIAGLKEAILELSKQKTKKRRSTKLVMLPAQQSGPKQIIKQQPKQEISRHEELKRLILGR